MDSVQYRTAVLVVRVSAYILVAIVTLIFTAWLFYLTMGRVLASVLSVMAAALVSNLVVLRSTEHRGLLDVGLRWSDRNLLLGLAGGIGAALLVLLPPLLLGAARLTPRGETVSIPAVAFTLLALMIGASGEELLFRGYAFQVLAARTGALLPILAISLLFGWGHMSNPHSTVLGSLNTALWGIALAVAVLRSRDLWLAIGLHFGWNVTLVLFGVPLSGLTIKVTRYAMEWRVGSLWSGGEYGPEAGLLTLFVLPALGWFLYRAPVQRQENPLLQAPVEE